METQNSTGTLQDILVVSYKTKYTYDMILKSFVLVFTQMSQKLKSTQYSEGSSSVRKLYCNPALFIEGITIPNE